MSSLSRLARIICAVFVCVVGSIGITRAQMELGVDGDQRPNILIIVSDDHAYQSIGAYGSKIGATPGLDRLASQGATYVNAFVTNSLCGPSRACLLTSKYSNINGFKDNYSRFDASQPTFASYLSQAGYQTAWIGKWHLQSLPQNFDYFNILPGQGYYYNPEFIGPGNKRMRYQGYCTNIITDLTLDWLQSRDKSKPFCLVVGEKATHRPWIPDTADFGKFDHINFPLPDDFYDNYEGRFAASVNDMNIEHSMRLGYDLKMKADTGFGREHYLHFTPDQQQSFDQYYDSVYRDFKSKDLKGPAMNEWKFQRYMKDYYATVSSLDRNISRIIDFIDSAGLGFNTIVIYTSDQGMYLGEHNFFDKRFMYEPSFKTPLIIRYPPLIAEGSVDSSMVMLLDMAPTFLELGGVKVPRDMQGQSLVKEFKLAANAASAGRSRKSFRKAVFYHYYEYPNEHHALPHFGIRTQRYKLIRFYDPNTTADAVQEGDGTINESGPKDYWELYDLEADPGEIYNIYAKNATSLLVRQLKRQLQKLVKRYKQEDAQLILKQSL